MSPVIPAGYSKNSASQSASRRIAVKAAQVLTAWEKKRRLKTEKVIYILFGGKNPVPQDNYSSLISSKKQAAERDCAEEPGSISSFS